MQDQDFWHNKWAANQIGFHLEDVNPLLTRFWSQLNPQRDQQVLVPLCGKSEDLIWLAQQHNGVTGVELSSIAVRSFFAEHFYTPTVTRLSSQHELYQFDELMIFNGDFFTAPLTQYDCIYDRAALVALPEPLRQQYAQQLLSRLKPNGKVLLVTLDYPQREMSGPPFSVPEQELQQLFAGLKLTQLHQDIADSSHPKIQNGLSHFSEQVWLLEMNATDNTILKN